MLPTASSSLCTKLPTPTSTGNLSIIPSLRQASRSQSRHERRAEPAEGQRLIGDGHTDWMTEKVDLSSFVSSSPAESSPSSSLPPSPLEQDVIIKAPTDLEVMTSLLQEELAQLEDYFRSETTSAATAAKLERSSSARCEKGSQGAIMGTQSYYHQLPYHASYHGGGTGGPSEVPSPVVVSLATGTELDLASFCGGGAAGPIGVGGHRSKLARPAPYNYHHHHHHRYHHGNNGPRRLGIGADATVKVVGEEMGLDTWGGGGSRGGYSGSTTELSVNHYSTLKTVSSKTSVGVKKVRECALSLKEEESYCFSEGMFCSEEIARGFCLSGSYDSGHGGHKREGQLAAAHSAKVNGSSYDVSSPGLEVLHCGGKDVVGVGLSGSVPPHHHHHHDTMVGSESYFHQTMAGTEPYHSFIGDLDQPSQAQAVEPHHGHYLYPECLADQSYECLSTRGESEGPLVGASMHHHRTQAARGLLKDEHCSLKSSLVVGGAVPLEVCTGERKQKKRDQNKTAAHRYRLRKRAELDTLEEELHGLEGQNRELRDKAESVEREIQYVKDLLIEVYKARSQRLKQDGSA